MTRLLVLLLLITQTQNALASSCRDAIVSAYSALGSSIDKDSFSNYKFNEFNISNEYFNRLTPEEQDKIYKQIKPLEIMTEETLSLINQQINDVAGTYAEFFMYDNLESWRNARAELRSCTLQD